MAYRQCSRRLWLEVHHADLRVDDPQAAQRFNAGHQVGAIARELYDPDRQGELIDAQTAGFQTAFERSRSLLSDTRPIFEAGFSDSGALFFADVMTPDPSSERGWKIIEVKSTTDVKDYHLDDVAVQAFVATRAGVRLASMAVAHIDSSWRYPGDGDYRGLLKEVDVTDTALDRASQVANWIADAQAILAEPEIPTTRRGRHCSDPFECGFSAHCHSLDPDPPLPSAWLPRVTKKALKSLIEDDDVRDLHAIPDELLNPLQMRVKKHTLENRIYFDRNGASEDLRAWPLPAWFLDFETIQFAVPIWPGTRPYEQIPFQYSLHRLEADGGARHNEFLDLSGRDPSEALARALVDACGDGYDVIFAYNAGFERRVVLELAARFPEIAPKLRRIAERLVDLLPIARDRFYHPSQKGSWSIKAVLPAVAPDLRYDELEGVQNGGMAQQAYLEAIADNVRPERREEIRIQLERYCELDTWAMVRLWQFLAGQEGRPAEK